MPSVVGLGDLAGEIVGGFEKYPQYDVYRIWCWSKRYSTHKEDEKTRLS